MLDPSCAPGVCTPIWGGLLAREAIELMRGLAGLNIIAIDVNTVSPPHDLNGMTAFLASTRAVVDRCYVVALQMGGRCEGMPGLRPHYHPNYYGAYFRDPDGNKICVCCHEPAPP